MKRLILLTFSLAVVFTSCKNNDSLDRTIVFGDTNFKAYVVKHFDTDEDGEINLAEAAAIKNLKQMWGMGFTSLQGIEAFPNLQYLYCDDNKLTELDVSKNLKLTTIFCGGNQITKLDVSGNIALKELAIGDNPIEQIDVSKNIALEDLKCASTGITTLDLKNNPLMAVLYCGSTSLSALDLNSNTMLKELDCAGTRLTTLDVSNHPRLVKLYCDSNPQLKELFLKSGQRSAFLEFHIDEGTCEVKYK